MGFFILVYVFQKGEKRIVNVPFSFIFHRALYQIDDALGDFPSFFVFGGNSLEQHVHGLLEVLLKGDFYAEVCVESEFESEGSDDVLEEAVDSADSEVWVVEKDVFEQCFRSFADGVAVEL